MSWKSITIIFCFASIGNLRFAEADELDRVSFRNDVMAVLSKAGCNTGVCHGNANGKGGLSLSLRGDDPERDFETLSHDLGGRRTNVLQPDGSLILRKPTMQVAHEGGKRFDIDSPEYRILRRWLAEGMRGDPESAPRVVSLKVDPGETVVTEPQNSIQLRVEAEFTDGRRRDVSRLAVYEPSSPSVTVSKDGLVEGQDFGEVTVIVRYLDRQMPARIAFLPKQDGFVFTAPEPANFIDQHVFAKLRMLNINPSAPADDTVFLRRASLDLLGMVPTANEARRFVADKSPSKRKELIDRYLKRPEFADYWALKWSDLLRNEEKTLDRKGAQAFHSWIRQSIADGKPLDQFARELISARGSTYANPEANFYRAMRDPFMRAESTAQLFLGVRLQCAKCHSHPFDRWTQDDYYGWANVFARVKYKILENNRQDDNDSHEFEGEQIVYMAAQGDVKAPSRGRIVAPRFLGQDGQQPDAHADRLLQLADWVSSPRNDRFVKTQVNRIWSHLMGRGIVEPIDDFRATNPPVNPQLLDALCDEFVASKFDLRHMIRLILNSRTYQLSSLPNESNADDEANFSHAIVRRLSAEQLLDSASQIVDVPVEFNGYPLGMRASQIPGVHAIGLREMAPGPGDQFLMAFGKPERLQSCECERSNDATLGQAFQLTSGELVNELLTADGGRLQQAIDNKARTNTIVDDCFWASLSRMPTDAELHMAVSHIDSSSDRRAALEDVVWALITSDEFVLRR